MTDAEMIEAYRKDRDLMFSSDFQNALIEREKEIEVCSDFRLGELIQLALAIDCYHGPQASFLGQCAYEAADRVIKLGYLLNIERHVNEQWVQATGYLNPTIYKNVEHGDDGPE